MGFYIREWMDKRGETDAGLAKKLGVARETVTRWRSHPMRLDPQKIFRIAAALELHPVDLYDDPNAPDAVGDLMRSIRDTQERKSMETLRTHLRLAGVPVELQARFFVSLIDATARVTR